MAKPLKKLTILVRFFWSDPPLRADVVKITLSIVQTNCKIYMLLIISFNQFPNQPLQAAQ